LLAQRQRASEFLRLAHAQHYLCRARPGKEFFEAGLNARAHRAEGLRPANPAQT
jgi:hypothetical protein